MLPAETAAPAERFAGKGLAAVRGDCLLFKGLHFQLDGGEALVLRGTNGSGKTTLMKIMAGLTAPLAGEIAWGGTPLAAQPERHRMRIGLIGHRAGLKEDLSVRECLQFEAGLRGAGASEVAAASERLGLTALQALPLRFLSAGQRRRVALARLAMHGPELWLLDEPATALDSAGKTALWQLCRDRLKRGNRLVIASHGPVPLEAASLAIGRFAP